MSDWKPTKAQRETVAIAAGGGMAHEEIALALDVSLPKLRKMLAAELANGAHDKRMRVIEAIHRLAVKGNAAAARVYLSAVPQAAAPAPEPEKPKVEPLGKKAAANEEAKTAQVGTGWADILPGGTGSRIQ